MVQCINQLTCMLIDHGSLEDCINDGTLRRLAR